MIVIKNDKGVEYLKVNDKNITGDLYINKCSNKYVNKK